MFETTKTTGRNDSNRETTKSEEKKEVGIKASHSTDKEDGLQTECSIDQSIC